jgi:MtN3 and saliva related transmembrane protein
MSDVLAVMAASWGVVMALAPLLQIRRMLERRSSADVSTAYLAVLEVGFVLWIVYGLSIGNPAIVVPNVVAFTIGAATIAVVVRFRTRGISTPRSGVAGRLDRRLLRGPSTGEQAGDRGQDEDADDHPQ